MTIDTIWYTRCPVPTAFSVALQLGWLDEEFGRDDVAFRSLATSRDPRIRQSHFEHSQANSVRHGGGIPPLFARQRGGDLRVLGLSLSRCVQRVLALPDSGVRNAGDLAGKRLAVPHRLNDPIDFWRATTLRGFELTLKQAGLSLDDATLVSLPVERRFVDDSTSSTGRADSLWDARMMLGFQRDAAAALLRGEVDAIFTQGANSATLAAFLGANIVAEATYSEDDPGSYVNNQPFPLTISGAVIDQRPDLAARLVATVRRAASWAKSHESETKRIIAAETGLPEQLVDDAYGAEAHAQLDLDLSPRLVGAFRTLHDDIAARGFLEKTVDLDAFIDARPYADATEILARSA